MGTLIQQKTESLKKDPKKTLSSDKNTKIDFKNNKKLLKEYSRIRKHLEELRQSYASVDNASETDDIYFRLKKLEKVSKRLRKGSAFSKGAKVHQKLLKKIR